MIFPGWRKLTKWSIFIIIVSVVAYSIFDALTFDYSRAKEIAIGEMQRTCALHCERLNIRLEDLHGPVDAPTNSFPNRRKFTFSWLASNGDELLIVVVVDEWLLRDTNSQWTEKTDSPEILREVEKIRSRVRESK